jgi:hypothetical protein
MLNDDGSVAWYIGVTNTGWDQTIVPAFNPGDFVFAPLPTAGTPGQIALASATQVYGNLQVFGEYLDGGGNPVSGGGFNGSGSGSFNWQLDDSEFGAFAINGTDPKTNGVSINNADVNIFGGNLSMGTGSTLFANNIGFGINSGGAYYTNFTGSYTELRDKPTIPEVGAMPQVTLSSNVTLALTDAGKHFYKSDTSTPTVTIPANGDISFPTGTVVTIVCRGAGNVTVARGSSVDLYLAGNVTSANRTVTVGGIATLLKVEGNTWMINGAGVV